MTKRKFLDAVFALAPNEANKIMDAFDEYVESNEPHWIPVTERLPEASGHYLVTEIWMGERVIVTRYYNKRKEGESFWSGHPQQIVFAWMPLPEPFKGVTE